MLEAIHDLVIHGLSDFVALPALRLHELLLGDEKVTRAVRRTHSLNELRYVKHTARERVNIRVEVSDRIELSRCEVSIGGCLEVTGHQKCLSQI